MNGFAFSQLINTDFDVKNITVTPCTFAPENRVEYKNGRKNNLLHFVTSGTRTYNVGAREFDVGEGDIILIPAGTVYSCVTQNGCSGIGICFDIVGGILLPQDVYTGWQIDSASFFEYVDKMTALYTKAPSGILPVKALLLQALYALAKSEQRSDADYRILKPALDFIASHFSENRKISEYAALCNMSESHFRKKFVACLGLTPIEYRNSLRFALAKRLYSEGKTLGEISERTGFYDAGFFSKAYKKSVGASLKSTFEFI